MSPAGFISSAVDWREQLRTNQRRTRFVIIMFIALYMLLGVLADVYFAMHTIFPPLPVTEILKQLASLQIFPYATLTMVAAAAISIFVTYSFYDRLMLLGTDYHEVTLESAKNLQEQQL